MSGELLHHSSGSSSNDGQHEKKKELSTVTHDANDTWRAVGLVWERARQIKGARPHLPVTPDRTLVLVGHSLWYLALIVRGGAEGQHCCHPECTGLEMGVHGGGGLMSRACNHRVCLPEPSRSCVSMHRERGQQKHLWGARGPASPAIFSYYIRVARARP